MKFVLAILLLAMSSVGHAFECKDLNVQSLLPAGAEPKSVHCVASFHSGKDYQGPILNIASLAWPLGMQEQACEELKSSVSDPKSKLEYCVVSAQEPIKP